MEKRAENLSERALRIVLRGVNGLLKWGFILLFIFAIFVGGYAVYDYYKVRTGAELQGDLVGLMPGGEDFSLASLQDINPDIVAWVKVDDTNINYPVVQGADNSEYLNVDYRGSFSTAGSVFLDYRNQSDFSDDYSIIYGHNMRARLMFSDIKKFEDLEFFATHNKGKLYTSSGVYDLTILDYAKFSAFANEVYNLVTYRNGMNGRLLQYFKAAALHERSVKLLPTDKLVLLSTCNTAGSNDRAVLLTRARLEEGADTVIGNSGELEKIDAEKRKLEETDEEKPGKQTEEKREGWKLDWGLRDWLLLILTLIVIGIFMAVFIKRVREAKKEQEMEKVAMEEQKRKEEQEKN